ncbi:hypothetical protein Tco_1534468 [Tanacetum coccineum]
MKIIFEGYTLCYGSFALGQNSDNEAELFAELTDKKDANISEIGIETHPNLKYYGGVASEDVCFLHDLAYIPESQENQSQL